MQPNVTDEVVWSLCLSFSLSVTIAGPAKNTEPIKMPFGLLTRVGKEACIQMEVNIVAIWQIRLNRLCEAAMQPFVKLFDHLLLNPLDNKNSSGDKITNVNFYTERTGSYRNLLK